METKSNSVWLEDKRYFKKYEFYIQAITEKIQMQLKQSKVL